MDELRLVRRDDQSLIVATDAGEEYRFVVDEAVLAELRHLGRLLERGERNIGRVNPREVQSLVRAGKSRAEIAEQTGLEESDIERYEEPVLAERRYMLELAHAIPVRTSPGEEDEQQFGTVIAERLVGLGADEAEWTSWRDEEAGWMIGLEFAARDVSHRAVWSFDHRKRQLSPITPDAETLSKQGEVGDRLIPKLRAVDSDERFDSGAFDPDRLSAGLEDDDASENEGIHFSGPVAPDHPSTGSIPVVGLDSDSEFARRQHIEERAIKTPAPELPDLGQTADLLDALRRRRGERDAAAEAPERETPPNAPVLLPGLFDDDDVEEYRRTQDRDAEVVDLDSTRPRSQQAPAEATSSETSDEGQPAAQKQEEPQSKDRQDKDQKPAEKDRRKGRASIPSWDDILFGTRSDEDPA
jgi:hypothetical protein